MEKSLEDIWLERRGHASENFPIKVAQRVPSGGVGETFCLIGVDRLTNVAFGYYEKREKNLIRRSLDKKKWRFLSVDGDASLYKEALLRNVRATISYLGDDPEREGLLETPERVLKSYDHLFSGYKLDPKEVFKVFDSEGYDELVLLKNCEFYSTCEHHLLPFFGRFHLAYIPNEKVIGVSKLARLFEIFSRRLQIQERIGKQAVNALMENLKCIGAACIIEAQHFCMTSRGVEKQGSIMTTSALTGVFKDDSQKGIAARAELMSLIKL